MGYLDNTGLAYFWSKLKALLSAKADKTEIPTKISDLNNDSGFVTDAKLPKYAVCQTSANQKAKVATTGSGDFQLVSGAIVYVSFTYGQTYSAESTLNIDGTGAKPMRRLLASRNTWFTWQEGEILGLVYDGSAYRIMDSGLATTDYYGETRLTSNTASTSEELALTPQGVNGLMEGAISGVPAFTYKNNYAVGARVRHGDYIYECINAVTAGNDFNASDWQKLPSLLTQIEAKADTSAIPSKTSDLTNDSGYITTGDIPTKTSQLTNDSGFITSSGVKIEKIQVNSTDQAINNKTVNITVPTKTSALTNDSGYITSSNLPTKTSQLTNDSGYITSSSVPTKLSQLTNDGDGTTNSKYATQAYVTTNGGKIDKIQVNGTDQTISNKTVNITVPTKVSQLTNDSKYITSSSIPTKTSQLTNDSGYITNTAIPTKVSAFTNDSGYITSSGVKIDKIQVNGTDQAITNKTVNISVPTKTSGLTNDSGYITSTSLPKYGTCPTAAATTAKVVTTKTGDFKLTTGAMVTVLFTNAQSASEASTLNVDGTGAKTIKANTSTNVQNRWSAGETVTFVYDGTDYQIVHPILATDVYYGVTKLATTVESAGSNIALTPSAVNGNMYQIVTGLKPYSASSTYAVGDRVRYNGVMYQCTTAITTAEAWTASHWKQLQPILEQVDKIPKYATCNTAGNAPAKVASTTNGDFLLKAGTIVAVTFTNSHTVTTTPTLNIDGTGAKPLGSPEGAAYAWKPGETVILVYTGDGYIIADSGRATTTYFGETKLDSSATSASTTTAATPSAINAIQKDTITGLDPFSTTKIYAVGDRVRYGSAVYQCSTAASTAGAWNSSNWTKVDPLLTQINSLEDMLTTVSGNVTKLGNIINPVNTNSNNGFNDFGIRFTAVTQNNSITYKFRRAILFIYRASTTANATIATVDQWGGIAYVNKNASWTVTTANAGTTTQTITIKNAASAAVNVVCLGFGATS